ncbi:DUF501 domain-containing protein [Kineobactrum salinum]|uniref:DUF501 domain-containing protein n=1 Tax=Kineobactrum salinum TaxID=2708301 RepID=A0A6C0U467_9GAMM|nr:DUF501 domain-containing protein [Kineobactrum salinum]QIB66728.1 DUF501 domain-containing protein [Kineobactrum salinum]
MTISQAQSEQVAALLGREARGLQAIAVMDAALQPRVIRVASLVDEKPFPTLFWLVDPVINYRIDQDEARGLIKDFQGVVNTDSALQEAMCADHRAHIELRDSYLDEAQRTLLDELGFAPVLARRGIGGIADFSRIRCLHTWYAAHLVVPNTIGRMLDRYWDGLSLPRQRPA